MDSIMIWPDRPALSLLIFWGVSAVFLWAAREPMRKVMHTLGTNAEEGLRSLASQCNEAAERVRQRSRGALLASGVLDSQARLDREFHRIDKGFTEKLADYSKLHLKLDDLLLKLEADYKQCGDSPPEVPGWAPAVETIAKIAPAGDSNVTKVLDGIRRSMQDAEKKALHAYRDDSAKRHKVLSSMLAPWKEIRALMARLQESVSGALDTTKRIDGYFEEYRQVRDDEAAAARTLTQSAFKLFWTSVLVLTIAFGGAFINFQLIALPMSELVPAGARIGGMPVSMVSALVIVLMEAAIGLFVMDMLGITELFPKLSSVPASKRRLILGLALGGLFFLSSVESSLAILREQIVAADAELKRSLAGAGSEVISTASESSIPVIGQAVLGFVLPWILAMVAIPIEMLFDSGRHVSAWSTAMALNGLAQLARLFGHLLHLLTPMLMSLYDVYISIPLRIEALFRKRDTSASSGVA